MMSICDFLDEEYIDSLVNLKNGKDEKNTHFLQPLKKIKPGKMATPHTPSFVQAITDTLRNHNYLSPLTHKVLHYRPGLLRTFATYLPHAIMSGVTIAKQIALLCRR